MKVIDDCLNKVQIRFRQKGSLSASTYIERLRRMHGVEEFQTGEDPVGTDHFASPGSPGS